MKKIRTTLLLSAIFAAGLPLLFAAGPAYDYLSGLAGSPSAEIPVPLPFDAEDDAYRYENPPCVPSDELLPGRGFFPAVSDARRERAIEDLLARLAVCRPMPYDNDGNIHSKPRPGLPRKPYGYYREYTLIVPGRPTGSGPEPVVIGGQTYMAGPVLSFRGAERLLIGDHREIYYTPDHYSTFVRLDIVR